MKTFVMTAFAAVLLSTAASANTVTVQCSDDVERGTLKLTNPPTMNCEDFELVSKYVGSGVTVGPNSKVNDLVSEIEKLQPAPTAKPVPEVSTEPLADKFSGLRRQADWLSEDELRARARVSNCSYNVTFDEDGGVTIKR